MRKEICNILCLDGDAMRIHLGSPARAQSALWRLGMANWFLQIFRQNRPVRQYQYAIVDDEIMREAAKRARERLISAGRLDIEIEAQREIRERARSAA